MVSVKYLKDMTGIQKFAVCTSCGMQSTHDDGSIRITTTRDSETIPRTETMVLCSACARRLKDSLLYDMRRPSVSFS